MFRLQVHFHADETHFHKKGFSWRLVLKEQLKVTQKWPFSKENNIFFQNDVPDAAIELNLVNIWKIHLVLENIDNSVSKLWKSPLKTGRRYYYVKEEGENSETVIDIIKATSTLRRRNFKTQLSSYS